MYSAVRTLEHDGRSACAVESDGSALYTAGRDGMIRAWDLEDGHCLLEWAGQEQRIETLASPAVGQLVSAGDGGDISLWDSDTGERLGAYSGHADVVTDLDVDATGAIMASVSYDQTVKRWDINTPRSSVASKLTDRKLVTVAVSPDSKVIAYGGVGPTLRLWNVDSDVTHPDLGDHEDAVVSVAFATDGTQLISIDHGGWIRWWDTDSWKVVTEHELTATGDYPLSICAETVAVGTDQGVSLFDPDGGLRSELDIDAGVADLAFGDGGSLIVTGTFDGRAIVFRNAVSA